MFKPGILVSKGPCELTLSELLKSVGKSILSIIHANTFEHYQPFLYAKVRLSRMKQQKHSRSVESHSVSTPWLNSVESNHLPVSIIRAENIFPVFLAETNYLRGIRTPGVQPHAHESDSC